MSDRLQELLRQRRLIEEHLAWLNREIGAAAAVNPLNNPVPPAPEASDTLSKSLSLIEQTVKAAAPQTAEAPETEIDPLLAPYREEPKNLQQSVKRGCLLYFCAGMGLMLLSVFLVYLHYRNRAVETKTTPPQSQVQPASPRH